MKKIYLSPAIETLEIRSAFAVCDGTVGGSTSQPVNPVVPGPPGGGGGSPAPRRPF